MNAIPSRDPMANAQRRVDRAMAHMIAARSREWRHLWGEIFVICVRARNAMRTPREIRALEKARGLR